MRFRVILSATLAAGVMCLASASNAQAFELLDRVLNVGHYGHGCGCDNACGCESTSITFW